MAIQTAALITGMKNLADELLTAAQAGTPKPDGYYEEQLGALLETFVLSAQAKSGIPVQVNTTTGTGSTTAPGALE